VAKASIGYINRKGQMDFFEGSVEGQLVKPSGSGGFGWDVIFQPEGFEQTYADMRPYEKNRISHRFKALENFRKFYYSP
jgi:non-canonical purine NTP pyrophosphatase (RdgB/HAM1 family)